VAKDEIWFGTYLVPDKSTRTPSWCQLDDMRKGRKNKKRTLILEVAIFETFIYSFDKMVKTTHDL